MALTIRIVRRTSEAATADLRGLIAEIPGLVGLAAGSAEHVRWVAAVRSVLSDSFGEDSDFYQSFVALPWWRTGTFAVGGPGDPQASMNPGAAIAREHRRAYVEQLDGARGLPMAELEEAVDPDPAHRFMVVSGEWSAQCSQPQRGGTT